MTFEILLSPPDVGELEYDFVMQALKSGWVAPAGPDLTAFEDEVAHRVGRRFAVGLSPGTAGLHLALVSWGIGPGDVVLVPTFTFAATLNAVRYVGATPHFVDCDPRTGNIDIALAARALETLPAQGARVRVLIAVDMFGKCADYDGLRGLCETNDLLLLSDAAESFGAAFEGIPAGGHGDVAVLSFNGNKIMTTSGGGMLLTDDEAAAAHVRKLSTQARESVSHYEHTEVGYNYRLSNILAALGRAQLQRLDSMLARRRRWRDGYKALFAESPGVRILGGDTDREDNCWLTAVIVDPRQSAWTAQDLAAALTKAAVETRPVWKPMHLQPVNQVFASTLSGAAEALFDEGLTLPSGSAMSEAQFDHIVSTVTNDVLAAR